MAESSWDLSSRTRFLTVVVVVAALAMTLGWVVASRVKSPADVVAGSRPPASSVITAPAENRRLAAAIVTRGTIGSLATVSGLPVAPPSGVSRAILTAVPIKVGSSLTPGSVVLEVSGNPVFFLPGRIAPYRDLNLGDHGRDVRQLQKGLGRAGLGSTDPSGTYGTATAAAVRTLFRRKGYSAPAAGGRLPMSAVVFVAGDRASVTEVKAALNQPLAEAAVSLASGDLVVLVDVPPAAAGIITVGATVRVTAEMLDETADGRVVRMLAGTGEKPPRAVVAASRTLPASWAGQDVRVEAASQRTAGEVLAVPVSALFRAGDGKDAVVVVGQDGAQRSVDVSVGASASGFVEVTPRDPRQLAAGDAVLVGKRR